MGFVFRMLASAILFVWLLASVRDASGQSPQPAGTARIGRPAASQPANRQSGCTSCHSSMDSATMHEAPTVQLSCVDCHGGNNSATTKEQAHVQPRFPNAWPTSGNPVRSYTLLNDECPEFVRFVNPGDLRVVHLTCGTSGCHPNEVHQVRRSMMSHGAMLWGAALYNNGAFPLKNAHFGESYSSDGGAQRLQSVPPPAQDELRRRGILASLDPLPRFELTQPGNILRIFERGGRFRPDVGIPERAEEPGRPRARLSNRGLGTENRTDPVYVSLQKTRLLDPTLNFLGTNDHPGDFRSSGCTACHVIYANDRSPVHSGPFAAAGHMGLSRSKDPTIPRDEPGHPIEHRLTRSIPTSQCIVCHIHPGTTVTNTYLGTMWWDNETDGEWMYPKTQRYPTSEEVVQAQLVNPEESAARGNWSDPEFLSRASELNPQLRHTQFADFHGHGWVFRNVYKQDRHGNLLDRDAHVVSHDDPDKFQKAVHLKDIHLEKGMHCVDCHFNQDVHGNGLLYGEVRNAVEIQCVDCHGSVTQRATLRSSGPAAPGMSDFKASLSSAKPAGLTSSRNGAGEAVVGTDLATLRTPFGARRFERRGDRVVQRSMVNARMEWDVPQVVDVVNPGHPRYNERARLAKTIQKDGVTWGAPPAGAADESRLAHQNSQMSCIACHSSFNASCFGCHLPMKANKKMPTLHWEGDMTRNYTSYNFQTIRDDVYMLGRDGTVTGNRIGPVRSACAVHVTSVNQNRETIYTQQQTVSSEGFSGVAFSPNVPHTVRGRGETKLCTDCHVSRDNDNNAILAQLLMHGTGFVNFMGRYGWVATGREGLEAVVVTEREEPQAVIGSTLHQLAFPDYFRRHIERGSMLQQAFHHPGRDVLDRSGSEVLSVQLRGEYLYAACGAGGLRVFDVAFIDDKAFSERIVTAPVSPLGQRFFVKTRYATHVAAPATMAVDPTRTRRPENQEGPIHPLYGYLYVTDLYEGLILVPAATLLDGNPLNNFLERAVTFNPGGILNGARSVTIAGNYAYVCCDHGLVVVALDDPLHPQVAAVVGDEFVRRPTAVAIQFRYAFVCDDDGIKVLNVTDLSAPRPAAALPLQGACGIYIARTVAYVACGPQGLAILDIERPEQPVLDQVFDAGGQMTDVRDVKLGMTNVSEFAYVADGCNGLRVVQLTSPNDTPGHYGFSPRPRPRLIATYRTKGPALSISRGLDRDRAVDECGNQLSVFGRVGSRPLNWDEQRRLYIRNGRLYTVSNDPPAEAQVTMGRGAGAVR
jgi:hypothetical protein